METVIFKRELNQVKRSLEVSYDDCGIDIEDELFNGDDLTFISTNRNYSSYGTEKNFDIDDMVELLKTNSEYEAVKIYAYIHGGISLSLNKFSCSFDSGVFGFLLFKKGEFGEDNKGVESFVKTFNSLLSNEVYRVDLVEYEECNLGGTHRTIIESMCGIYGYADCDSMLDEVVKEYDL